MLRRRDEELQLELTTAVDVGTAVVKTSSEPVSRTDALAARGDPDQTKTAGVHVLEWTILAFSMLLV